MNYQHQEVAEIYDRVLKGDKFAINQLHKVGDSPLKKPQRVSEKEINHAIQKPANSQDLTKASKSQNFRNYLKEKVGELGSGNQLGSKKQISKQEKETSKQEYTEPKPFEKVRKSSQSKPQKKPLSSQTDGIEKPSKPPQQTKTASHNFQENIKRNIIKDTITEKQQQTPPSSKHSFRIRTQGGNKKLLEELMRLNEEERLLQIQILDFHKLYKDVIGGVCHKYGIEKLEGSMMRESGEQEDILDSPTKLTPKLKQGKLGIEEANISRLQKEILIISKQIENKKTEVAKKQAKMQVMPLITYLNSNQDIFQQERESEQQAEEVGALPQSQPSKSIDPTKTYQSVMSQMRKKKWGLNQRVNYQSQGHRDPKQADKSPKKNMQKQFSPAKVDNNQEGTKIVVNSRLKQYLFD